MYGYWYVLYGVYGYAAWLAFHRILPYFYVPNRCASEIVKLG